MDYETETSTPDMPQITIGGIAGSSNRFIDFSLVCKYIENFPITDVVKVTPKSFLFVLDSMMNRRDVCDTQNISPFFKKTRRVTLEIKRDDNNAILPSMLPST